MAQSHIKITGGLLDGKSMRNTITVAGHTFEAGQALRFNRGAGTGVCGDFYAPAIADSAANSEVIGVVESVEGSSFVLVYGGEIATANFDGKYALEDDDVFFLSGITPGLVDKVPPSTAGQVIKPVLVRSEGNKAIVTNFIGTVIGGSSVVNLDGIQPVGTIEPYAGQANDVPETWSLCDGGALSTTAFIDLYNRIGREFGYHVTIQDSAITSGKGIAIGQVVQQGGRTGRIVSIDFALNQIVVDVDYLKSTGTIDGFLPHNETFSSSDLTIPKVVSVNESEIYAGSITPKAEPEQPETVTLSSATVTITAFRKPDLRGKVVMGSASLTPEGNDQEGTLIVTDRNSPRGSILGEYEHQLSIGELPSHSHTIAGRAFSISINDVQGTVMEPHNDSYGSNQDSVTRNVGGNQSHNIIQPTVAINWIIKTTANAAAAVIDNLTTQIPLTDLTDVSITPSDGDIVMYDASNTPVKFKAYNLLTNYKSNAEQIFQIDTSGTNPKVRFGGPDTSSANGFSVNLDGLGSGVPKFEVLNSGNSPLMSLQKTTTTNQTYGIASIGTNGVPSENANLSLGSKGLLFTQSSSTPVNKIVTVIAPSATATDTNLVTEKAIRDAISDISVTAIQTYFVALHGESFPSWSTARTTGSGVKFATVGADNGAMRVDVTNGTPNDIIVTMSASQENQQNFEKSDMITVEATEEIVSAGDTKRFTGTGVGVNYNGGGGVAQSTGICAFRQATSTETAQGFGEAHASFTP